MVSAHLNNDCSKYAVESDIGINKSILNNSCNVNHLSCCGELSNTALTELPQARSAFILIDGFVLSKGGVGGANVRDVDASKANSAYDFPPYNPNKPIRDFEADGSTKYVRVYTEGTTNQGGRWIMNADDIAGLSPQQIQNKFDLPYTSTHITDVKPQKGTTIRTGAVNSGNFGGNGGGTQFELRGLISDDSFSNPRAL